MTDFLIDIVQARTAGGGGWFSRKGPLKLFSAGHFIEDTQLPFGLANILPRYYPQNQEMARAVFPRRPPV